MNFLDLSSASEEERRLINEILSDTSVVNISAPFGAAAVSTPCNLSTGRQRVNNINYPTNNNHSRSPPTSRVSSTKREILNSVAPSQQSNSNKHVTPLTFQNNQYQVIAEKQHPHSQKEVSVKQTSIPKYKSSTIVPSSKPLTHTTPTTLQQISNQQAVEVSQKAEQKITNDHNNIDVVANTNLNENIYEPTSSDDHDKILSQDDKHLNLHSSTHNSMLAAHANLIVQQQDTRTAAYNSHNSIPINNNISATSASQQVADVVVTNTMLVPTYNNHPSLMHQHVPPQQHPPPSSNPTANKTTTTLHYKNIAKNQPYMQDTSNSTSISLQQGSVAHHQHSQQHTQQASQVNPNPEQSQMSTSNEMGRVMSIDMTNQQQDYATMTPHVAAFPPPPPHVYGGPPIFQSYGYIIPYHPQPYVPFVMPPGSVVPRQPAQLANQPSNTHLGSSNSRHHYQPHAPHSQSPHQHNQDNHFTNMQPSKDPIHISNKQLNRYKKVKPMPYSDKDLPNQNDSGLITGEEPKVIKRASGPYQPKFKKDSLHREQQAHTNVTDEQPVGDVVVGVENMMKIAQNQTPIPAQTIQIDSSKDNIDVVNGDSILYEKTHSLIDKSNDYEHAKPSSHNDPHIETTENDVVDLNNQNNNISCPGSTDSENAKTISSETSSPIIPSNGSKSWADLFKHKKKSVELNSSFTSDNVKHTNNVEDKNRYIDQDKTNELKTSQVAKEHKFKVAAKKSRDKFAPKLAQKIFNISLKHSLPFLRPRGFINKGNGCYINAVLQALVVCPPFYNVMREIGEIQGLKRENSCTPIIDSFAEFFQNFLPADAGKKIKSNQTGPNDQKPSIEDMKAESMEPKSIYNVLGHIKLECLKGAQEDAEEFLSSVLNGLHEEMIELSQLLPSSSTLLNGHTSDADDTPEDNDLWHEVGPKNRSLPTRTTKVVNTPIQEIFGGSLFSVRTVGKGDKCGYRQPFFALQLDISGDYVKSILEAIKSFTTTEVINDFYCSKAKQKVDAYCKTSLEQLPPILILHLKQFVYSQDQGLKKLVKKIDYPMDFELPDSCLHDKHPSDKSQKSSRSYKLLAVVYHDGREAIKGHYLTDVYHIGTGQWIRCDDSNIRYISSPIEKKPESRTTPYLLFYRRHNTLLTKNTLNNRYKNI